MNVQNRSNGILFLLLLVPSRCVSLLTVSYRNMSTKRIPIDQVGAELVETSRSESEESLPLSTRLFPYIYVASRNMSTRAISRWLAEKHEVSLSAAAISRALNSPRVHLERLAEYIAASARYVAILNKTDPMNLLFSRMCDGGPLELDIRASEDTPNGEDDIYRCQEVQDLAAVWVPIPHEVQLLLAPYLREELKGLEYDSPDEDDNY